MRTLVVAEKFNTALRIAVVLSDGRMKRTRVAGTPVFEFERDGGFYAVVGLRGHIVELDYPPEFSNWSLGSLPGLLEAEPDKRVTEPGIVRALEEIVRGFDRVIIATDFDREGELIGLECLALLQKVHPSIAVKRARYSALTREAIEESFAHLAEVDRALAEAGEARQEIDLAWGALLTRYLSLTAGQRGRSFLSAGRVQTPTLALLVERDQEIKEFEPKPFWQIGASGEQAGEPFSLRHEHGTWDVQAEAEAVFARVRDASQGLVKTFAEEPTRRRPPIPFSTTLFVAEATRLGIGAAAAMRYAEDLYTQGLISYPRTDNTVYPRGLGLRTLAEKFKDGPFAEAAEFVLAQPSFHPSRGRVETTDHPRSTRRRRSTHASCGPSRPACTSWSCAASSPRSHRTRSAGVARRPSRSPGKRSGARAAISPRPAGTASTLTRSRRRRRCRLCPSARPFGSPRST